jgi:hypothetical protein
MTPEECLSDVREWLQLKLTKGRCSNLLASELAHHMSARTLDVFNIYDEIGALEGASHVRQRPTKPAAPFTGKVLKGLWHKHYTTAGFIPRNLVNHWTLPRLEALLSDVRRDALADAQLQLDRIAHSLVMDGYRDRAAGARLTGEWIVFAKGEANIYLTLARHDELDEAILVRCRAALADSQWSPGRLRWRELMGRRQRGPA